MKLAVILAATSVAASLTFVGTAAAAVGFRTCITNNDRYNTHGARLHRVGQILQQNRANAHGYSQYGPGYFGKLRHRNRLSHAGISAPPWLRRAIVRGGRVCIGVRYFPRRGVARVWPS